MNFLKNIGLGKNIINNRGLVISNKLNNGINTQLFNINKFYMVQIVTLENKLRNKIKCDKLEIEDISGNCGTSFSIKLTSPDFKGKSMIMQHRMVNDALKDEMKDIHALQIKSEASK